MIKIYPLKITKRHFFLVMGLGYIAGADLIMFNILRDVHPTGFLDFLTTMFVGAVGVFNVLSFERLAKDTEINKNEDTI